MDSIFRFFGDFLSMICAGGGGMGLAVAVFAAIAAVFMLIPMLSEIRSLQLAEEIRPIFNWIVERYERDSDKMGKELLLLSQSFGYHTFLGFSGNLVHILAVVLLFGTFSRAGQYLTVSPKDLSFLWIRDLTASPLALLREGRLWTEGAFAAMDLLLADILMSRNAHLLIRKSLMPVKTLCQSIHVLTLLACFFAPQAVTVYFLVFYLLKNIISGLALSKLPYKLSPAHQQTYQKYVRRMK